MYSFPFRLTWMQQKVRLVPVPAGEGGHVPTAVLCWGSTALGVPRCPSVSLGVLRPRPIPPSPILPAEVAGAAVRRVVLPPMGAAFCAP